MGTIILELSAAEGGDDSKDLVNIMAKAYTARCVRRGL